MYTLMGKWSYHEVEIDTVAKPKHGDFSIRDDDEDRIDKSRVYVLADEAIDSNNSRGKIGFGVDTDTILQQNESLLER